MAYAKHIETDRGLTARMFVTGLFLVILWGVLGGVLFAVGVGIGLIVVIELAVINGGKPPTAAERPAGGPPRAPAGSAAA